MRHARMQGAVTCLKFDYQQSRLLVGTNGGVVLLFNYANGQLLKQYQLRGSPDVSDMCSVREQVCVYVGVCIHVWVSMRTCVFSDSTNSGLLHMA